jgi:hypothetical protein
MGPANRVAHLRGRQIYPTKRPRATVGFAGELPAKSAHIASVRRVPSAQRNWVCLQRTCPQGAKVEPVCGPSRSRDAKPRRLRLRLSLAGMPWRRGAEWTSDSRCAFFRELMLSTISRLDQGARGNSDASDVNPALRKIRDMRIQLRAQDVCNDQGAKPSYEANIRKTATVSLPHEHEYDTA